MEFNSDLLKNLVKTFSPSGNEERVRELIINEIKDYVDEIEIDNLGNLIARKKGSGKKIMIAGHMDQIGLMITDIDKKGFLRFTNIGGISSLLSISQRVIFENGTIGVISNENVEDKNKLKLENLYIDIGAKDKEEAEKKVNVGDSCVYLSEYYEEGSRITSGCLDDRIGCYVMIEALKRLEGTNNDVYFTFTVQEELGIRGAKTSAYKINPDIGIAVDITGTGDTPKSKRFAVGLGKGTAIKVMDKSVIVHPKIKEAMVNTAKENKIKYQMEVLEYGGTDSGSIHLSREGVPSGVISIPTRYIHSPNETINKEDVENSILLLKELINKEFNL
ncbi:M42 family metallopeptidase [Clostridium sp. D2Q-11]|uniref:M42 family metallopeptidase n=1 Tax=Anaeromonas frigoriresistens TaxID=2683708 RepID=A0A942UYH5_9FIRM|nr:M42 family metallopeptidase [Anaeromonas frigoriresistens]MBS4539935.1 M42 family metallopeptidase [Anaeromonas frigoriresistens]